MPSYAERLAEFNRVTGLLRRCAPTCDFPDQPHEVGCPDGTFDGNRQSASPSNVPSVDGTAVEAVHVAERHTGGHLA